MLHRFRLIVLCTLIAGALGTALARAARAPTASESRTIIRPALRIVPRSVALGARVTLIGHGFRPRTSVWLGVGPPQSEATRVGSARTTPTGFFRKVLTVRRSWLRPSIQPGHYVALACQRGCRIKTGARFRIVTGRG